MDLCNALNWYSYMCDTADARKYLTEYLKDTGRTLDLRKAKKIPDKSFPKTSGWIARMLTNGSNLDERTIESMERFLNEAYAYIPKKEPVKKKKDTGPKLTVQDHIREKANTIIGELEVRLDKDDDINLYVDLQKDEVSVVVAKRVLSYYKPVVEELEQAKSGKDKDLKEAYGKLPKRSFNKMLNTYKGLVGDLEKYCEGAKRVRRTRKKKSVSVTKKVAKFNYLKDSKELKIVSADPTKIVGAKEVWLFNTKYERLTVYRALDRSGFDIKGSTIKNVDLKNSDAKRVGRKKEQIINRVMSGGKIILRKLMGEIKAKSQTNNVTGRVNKDTLILKIVV